MGKGLGLEMDVVEARKILGSEADQLSDNELLRTIAGFESLADCWLDQFETQIFGKPLKNLNIDNGNQ